MKNNKMREIEIEKMIAHCGGVDDKLDKSVKLLAMITKRKVNVTKARKRIPAFGLSPGKKSGCKVTVREKDQIIALLKRFLSALDNRLSGKQIRDNHLSFGIKEYIEIPGLEYSREIGILGFEVDISFKRKGKRVKLRKIKRGKYPRRQTVTKEEITEFLIKNFNTEVSA